ncbi:MAG: HEPN domain-containing protein [Candidatus Helarchaeota archaeon]
MGNNALDWLRQGEKDLKHAIKSIENQDYEWTCFSAQQAVEKVIRALFKSVNIDAWGHSTSQLLQNLPPNLRPDDDLINMAKELDKHYIPARYPNAHPSSAPMDYYTKIEAERAVNYAKKIIQFCKNKIVQTR